MGRATAVALGLVATASMAYAVLHNLSGPRGDPREVSAVVAVDAADLPERQSHGERGDRISADQTSIRVDGIGKLDAALDELSKRLDNPFIEIAERHARLHGVRWVRTPPDPNAPDVTLQGRVSRGGKAVPGVRVRFMRREAPGFYKGRGGGDAVCDDSGHYRIEGMKPGTFSVECVVDTVGVSLADIDVEAPGPVVQALRLPTGSLRVLVRSHLGAPVSDARLDVWADNRVISLIDHPARTDSTGSCTFDFLERGPHRVTAVLGDARSEPTWIDVSDGGGEATLTLPPYGILEVRTGPTPTDRAHLRPQVEVRGGLFSTSRPAETTGVTRFFMTPGGWTVTVREHGQEAERRVAVVRPDEVTREEFATTGR